MGHNSEVLGHQVGFKVEKGGLCGAKLELVKWRWWRGVSPLPVKPVGKSANVSRVLRYADGWIVSLRGLRA